MDEKWWVVTLDTALATNPYSSQGKFSEKLEAYLNEVLQLIPKDASILLLNHYPFFQNDVARHNLIRGEALEALLKKNKQIKLYLHGHTHRHTIADLQVSDLPIVLDPGSCAQGVKGSFNIIDLQKDACKVSTFRFSDKWTNTQIDEMKWTR
jgi:3',5'-cyclic AMP phosphodiesterase CpdA